jgi:hypothetical protein
MPRPNSFVSRTLGTARKNAWPLALLLIAAFLFYWSQIRPIRIYRSCTVQASVDAKSLLRSRAELAKGTPQAAAYESLVTRGMYLRADYQSMLSKCLLYYGMQLPADNALSGGDLNTSSQAKTQPSSPAAKPASAAASKAASSAPAKK